MRFFPAKGAQASKNSVSNYETLFLFFIKDIPRSQSRFHSPVRKRATIKRRPSSSTRMTLVEA